ncbi:MAG: imidazoleglycerol-phosphate dehydratase HisB [Anaerolineae bacterium]|nr:imidazoleglycerol-phosphate dehydratase HisB [Anaerolineae bacterium]
MRNAEIHRKTRETDICVRISLDGGGRRSVVTGVGFLDHMLDHLALHGMFDLEISASGDLYIDPHHLVEDCAIVLGQALDQALGDRVGIFRMGSAYVPMDDSLAFVSLDLSGRPYAVVEAVWASPMVGGISTTLIAHFFESFAFASRTTLHARLLYGRDDHHGAEALFKALGRALDCAVRVDSRRQNLIPSTKGSLT